MKSSKLSSGESPAHHPGLFNPVPAKSNLTFHLFPNLPKEIRDMIWTQSLICERYIEVELWGKDRRSGKFYRQEPPPCRSPVNQEYKLVLINPPRPNAMFGTSAESRASACRFYRVHFACYRFKKSLSHVRGTFRLNPELDTLQIEQLKHFAAIASHIWRHDYKKAGLRNVAFTIGSSLSFVRFRQLAASTYQLRQVVDQLQHITFIHYTEMDRVNLAFGKHSSCSLDHSFPLQYPRSLPVAGATGSFSRQQDPRPIEDNVLNSICIFASPDCGRIILAWMNWFQKLRAGRSCEFRFAYAAAGCQRPFITDRAAAMDYLKKEEKKLQEYFDNARVSPPRGPWLFMNGVPEQLDSGLETAFGFWTFPLEPQGPFAKDHPRPRGFPKAFYDFSAYQPELCVFHL
ncbi:hypothetical protein FPHYL_6496 [Fusarium phyllophilum]|uniref:2EXR domain-containing protein n=1 Tax=Fusarium phyllophilum TaxID=47803 RepID=A0A8H5ND58_9HYPO|nr:hypothetical protein FPHYL_6496 [Fusarium phyllophilum]